MQKYKLKIISFVIISLLFVAICLCTPYSYFLALENEILVTNNEFDKILKTNYFLYTHSITSVSADTDNIEQNIDDYILEYKLLNLFTVKKVRINVLPKDEYYAGGETIGLSLNSKGVFLVGGNYVVTSNGLVSPLENSGLKIGDLIVKLNNQEINNIDDITNALSSYDGSSLMAIEIKRNNQIQSLNILPAKDLFSNSYRLGFWVKDSALGIGTLTYINASTKNFGSLGHAICDENSGQAFDVSGGDVYNCKILGVKKATFNKAGELIGTFSDNNSLGVIEENCNFGVYGKFNEIDSLVSNKQVVELGGRLTAHPGKAQIISSIDGENLKYYDIEIIKTNYQSSANQKSMVIRVVDQELLNITGGIVQGMSGSPIIQDDKLIGAVTHVFVNDSTKGFGLYIDWMLEH